MLQIWFGYASAKMAAVARAQKSSCTCSTNTLQYSEQHLQRLGAIPGKTIAQELPFETCSSSSSSSTNNDSNGGCFAAKLAVGRPQTSFEWAGLFTFNRTGTYEWNFRSNGAPFGEFSYPDPAIGIWIVASADLESVQADAQAALETEDNSTVVLPLGTISLAEPRRQSLQFNTDALSTSFHFSVTAPGQTYAIYTEHMPWEFSAVHLIEPPPAPSSEAPLAGNAAAAGAAGAAVFPSEATEFDLGPGGSSTSDLAGADAGANVDIPKMPCIKARARNCRNAAKEGRCRWMKEEQQCTTCSGCSCHSKAAQCKSASEGCRWWEKQCVPSQDCGADDYSGCCEKSKRECVFEKTCRWDKAGKMCRGTTKVKEDKCKDIKGWKDSDKDPCDTYRSRMWCGTKPDGTEGTGLAWRSTQQFSDYTDPNSGLHAGEACCGCGGGSMKGGGAGGKQEPETPATTTQLPAPTPAAPTPPPPPPPPSPTPPPAVTQAAATPARASRTSTAAAPTTAAVGKQCRDLPRGEQSWMDKERDTCFTYEHRKWCGIQEKDGKFGYGSGWSDGETFEDYIGTNGLHAGQACCACGGGEMA